MKGVVLRDEGRQWQHQGKGSALLTIQNAKTVMSTSSIWTEMMVDQTINPAHHDMTKTKTKPQTPAATGPRRMTTAMPFLTSEAICWMYEKAEVIEPERSPDPAVYLGYRSAKAAS